MKAPRSSGFWRIWTWRSCAHRDREWNHLGSKRRRPVVSHVQRMLGASEQFSCCVTGQHQATQRYEPVTATPTIRMRHCGPRCATSASRITTPVQHARQSITGKCNAFGADKGFECHSAASTMATANRGCARIGCGQGPAAAAGRSRTDPHSVIPLGAVGASRSAGSRISRRTRRRGAQHRLRDQRCPPSEHR